MPLAPLQNVCAVLHWYIYQPTPQHFKNGNHYQFLHMYFIYQLLALLPP